MEGARCDGGGERRRRPAEAGTSLPTMMLGLVLGGAAAVGLVPAGPVTAEEPVSPATVAALEAEFAASIADLVRRCRRGGDDRLAQLIEDWPLPEPGPRQQILAAPGDLAAPAWLDTSRAGALWDDFVAVRKKRAAGSFSLAVAAARAHAAVPPRGAVEDPERPPWPDRGDEAIRLLHRTLRDDPDHDRARAVAGWVRRDGGWVTAAVARRLDRGEEYDARFGWLPRGRLERYRAGERFDQGRWIDAATYDVRPRSLERPLRFEADHWRIASTSATGATAAVASHLEETWHVWQQAFGGYRAEPAQRERVFEGRGKPPANDTFAATLVRDRGEYVAALEAIEPAAARTEGIYWSPTKMAWFIAIDDRRDEGDDGARTVRHEATHQLFAETRAVSKLAGERVGFWAIEAVACYMESLEPTPFGWTLGGPDAGRMPAARQRVLEDGFQVPLEELAALGRREFQADERLPRIYSQIAGLADFFMNGREGRYRDAFVEYLVRVYTGTATADTLAKLCRRTHGELDEEFRRHLATADSAAERRDR
ncbi:MAG: hypothetical protein ACKOCW_05180 [Planctomycetaceae bacterium]